MGVMTSNVTNLADARAARERNFLADINGPYSECDCNSDYAVTGATFHADTGWTIEITRPGQYATQTPPEVTDLPDGVADALIEFLELRADVA